MKTFISLLFYKRLLLFNVLIPLIFGFALVSVIGKSISSQMNNFDSTFSLGLVNLDEENELTTRISKRKDIRLAEGITASNALDKVTKGEIDLALILPEDMSEKIGQNEKIEVKLYHRGNQLKIEDLMSSITTFEENIIIQRMDSLGLPYSYINPIKVTDTDVSVNFIQKINIGISNYLPLLLLLFGYVGLVLPAIILFSQVKEKRTINSNPFWDKILGISLWSIVAIISLLIGMKISFTFIDGHPSFFVGMFKKYLSVGNSLNLIWMILLSNLFWTAVLGILNMKAKKPLGAFGISYFTGTVFISLLLILSIVFSTQKDFEISLIALIPPSNVWLAIKELLMKDAIHWLNILLYLISSLLWAAIGYFVLNKLSINSST